MRLDKYLKVSRIIKRRTVANEVCDAAKVVVNNRQVKASYNVSEGDIIEVSLGGRQVKVKVLSVDERTGKDAAREMYQLL